MWLLLSVCCEQAACLIEYGIADNTVASEYVSDFILSQNKEEADVIGHEERGAKT